MNTYIAHADGTRREQRMGRGFDFMNQVGGKRRPRQYPCPPGQICLPGNTLEWRARGAGASAPPTPANSPTA